MGNRVPVETQLRQLPDSVRVLLLSLLNLCSVKNQDAVLKLAVSTLDYSTDGLARVILSKILTAATDVRLYPGGRDG